jgi:xanthine dehydrogenase accessory factor
LDVYEEVLRIQSEGKKGALAIVIDARGSTPRKTGAKMVVHENGGISGTIGGGKIEAMVCQEALQIMRKEEPRTIHFDLKGDDPVENISICGGSLDVYIEPIAPAATVFIFGGGHISLFVARLSKMVGFEVAVIDDRAEFANHERFPEAALVIADEFPSAVKKLKVNRTSYLVIVTRGHLQDEEVLEWAARTDAKYVGMIGSGKKIQTVYSNLKKKGISQEQLKRVHAPIGLDIGAETPEEIAVSIVAEMIQVRSKG